LFFCLLVSGAVLEMVATENIRIMKPSYGCGELKNIH
jgi:hypothetical protein